jgi:hypothetical protein
LQPPVGTWLDIFLRKPFMGNSVQERGSFRRKWLKIPFPKCNASTL